MKTVHPCAFAFLNTDIRLSGITTDGGTSLSGIKTSILSDGGGFWQADYGSGKTVDRSAGLAWRAIITGLDAGATAVNVLIHERYFSPGRGSVVPHSDDTPFSDDTLYTSGGAEYYVTIAAMLRATFLTIDGTSSLPLEGGELFSILHPAWGWRLYRIISITDDVIEIRPPLRESVTADTQMEFDNPRCQMVLAGAIGNPTTVGKYTECALSFVEDMRKP